MSLHALSLPDPADAAAGADVDVLMAALDAMDSGVLVCDAHGRLLVCNRAARRELADGGVLQVGPGALLDVPGADGLLALRRAVHGAAVLRSHQLLPLRVGDCALMLSVQPLTAADGQPRALLLTGRRGLAPELAVRHIGRLFALTPAEVEVLGSLLDGVRVDEMAAARDVKLSTVRTQVAALRGKLGVKRIDDIIRLVAELPPMPGAVGRHVVSPAPSRLRAALGPQPGA